MLIYACFQWTMTPDEMLDNPDEGGQKNSIPIGGQMRNSLGGGEKTTKSWMPVDSMMLMKAPSVETNTAKPRATTPSAAIPRP